LKSGNLRLKNRDLVFLLFYRVINVRHVVILASLGNRTGSICCTILASYVVLSFSALPYSPVSLVHVLKCFPNSEVRPMG
jgi:hypothetical protein